ncbi:MAG: hypothetical protein ABW095_15125 [Candidatus Thiodiazotropha sp.]
MSYDEVTTQDLDVDRFQSMSTRFSLPIIDQAWFSQAQELGTPCQVPGITAHQVHEYQGLRWLRHEDGSIQSIIWLERPDYPVFEYVRGMLCGLLFHPAPQRLLNLGLGAGTLERFLLRNLTDITLTSVEPDRDIQRMARDCFDLPGGHSVVTQSAQDYLNGCQATYDTIFCDIHPGPGENNPLDEDRFMANLARVLAPDGVVAINLLPEDEREIVRLLMQIRRHLPHIALFDVPQQQNLVLFGGTSVLSEPELLLSRARAHSQYAALEAQRLINGFIRLPSAHSP